MVSFPHCKINLGLNVLSRREDGYHNIVTCFYPLPLTDILEIIPAPELSISFSGDSIPGEGAENLCLRAYHLLRNEFNISPVKIHLHKIVPIGGGLGGGSSDAAYTLRLLNEIFELNLPKEGLHAYASTLGSDCAFFLQETPMLGTGKGERLQPIQLNLSGQYLVLIKPPIHVSTANAYEGVIPNPAKNDLREVLENKPVNEWRGQLVNDFEYSVFKKFPVIDRIKEKLYEHGALYASMSGSGSSVYGIFREQVDLAKHFSEMFYWSSILE